MDIERQDLIIFPGAGSFGSEFQPIVRTLRPKARILRYPWRYEEFDGKCTRSFYNIAMSFAPRVRKTLASGERPILFGHSFGAYIAYATAAILEDMGCEIAGLVVVGANAPHMVGDASLPPSSSAEIEAYWTSIDPGLFERMPNLEWKELLIDTSRNDLNLLSNFCASDFGRLSCPIYEASGEWDPLVSYTGRDGWAEYTNERLISQRFSGGHTDLLSTEEFITWAKNITHA